jgi:hypothetical protein
MIIAELIVPKLDINVNYFEIEKSIKYEKLLQLIS